MFERYLVSYLVVRGVIKMITNLKGGPNSGLVLIGFWGTGP